MKQTSDKDSSDVDNIEILYNPATEELEKNYKYSPVNTVDTKIILHDWFSSNSKDQQADQLD